MESPNLIGHISLEGGPAPLFEFQNLQNYRILELQLFLRSNRPTMSDAVKLVLEDTAGNNYSSLIQWMPNKYELPDSPPLIGYAPAALSPSGDFCNISLVIYSTPHTLANWQARGMQFLDNVSGNRYIYDAAGEFLQIGEIHKLSIFPNIGTAWDRYSFVVLHGFAPQEPPNNLKIFVEMGQSNMVGSGLMKPNTPDINSFVLGLDYKWHQTQESVYELGGPNYIDPVNFNGYNQPMHYGMTNALSKRLHTHISDPLGFVPVAKAGSSVAEWARNLSTTTLYGAAYNRTQTALQKGSISGILFFQGEADARTTDANLWASHFVQLIYDLRSDYGNVPIIFFQLGANPDPVQYPYWDVVKAQQASINIAGVTMIQTDDLPMQTGLPHYTSDSYDVLGQRAADAIANLL